MFNSRHFPETQSVALPLAMHRRWPMIGVGF